MVTNILSREADTVFSGDYALGNSLLEAILRYTALKYGGNSLPNVTPIKAFNGMYRIGDTGNMFIPVDSDGDGLYIFNGNGRLDPLTIVSDGWVALDSPPFPVSKFLSAHASPTNIYINQNRHQVLVFVKALSNTWIERFCSTIYRLLWWIFPANLDEEDVTLFRAIYAGEIHTVETIFDSVAARVDLSVIAKHNVLKNYGDKIKRSQIADLEAQYASKTSVIEDYENELAKLYASLSRISTQILAVQSLASATEDLAGFFCKHKNLSVVEIDKDIGGSMALDYSISDVIEYYDKELFVRMYNNPTSYLRSELKCSQEQFKILYGLFALEKGFVKTSCVMRLHDLSSISARMAEIDQSSFRDKIPQPHIYHYGCLGSNREQIKEYFKRGDWDMAIEQSIAAAKNLNFNDRTVVKSFVADLFDASNNKKCIQADNGQDMTVQEFADYVKDEVEAATKLPENNTEETNG